MKLMKLKRILALALIAAVALQLAACAKIQGNASVGAGGVSVDEEMYSYMLNAYYREYAEKNSRYLEAMGLDVSRDVRDQTYGNTVKDTWYSYISSGFKAQLEETVALANGAGEAGIKLSAESKAETEKILSDYENEAKNRGIKLNAYLEQAFGRGVDYDCVKKCLEIKSLAKQFRQKIEKEAESLSQKDCESVFESSPESMLCYDCIKITVPKDKVEKFMIAYDKASFMTAVSETIAELRFKGNYSTFKEIIDRETQSKLLRGEKKTAGSAISDWAFAPERKAFDKYTAMQSTGDVTVAMILPAQDKETAYNNVLYRSAQRLKNVQIVRVTDEAEAKSLLKTDSDGKIGSASSISEKEFNSLREKYGSETLDNISRNDCPDEIRETLFSESINPKDAFICAKNSAYVAFRYTGEGEIAWIYEAKREAAEKAVFEKINEQKKKYPLKINEDKIAEIAIIPIQK